MVYEDFMRYRGGVYSPHPTTSGEPLGGHAVVIVGYGVDTDITGTRQIRYWKCKNSWTDKWGEGGYFRIERGSNAAEIESEVYTFAPTA